MIALVAWAWLYVGLTVARVCWRTGLLPTRRRPRLPRLSVVIPTCNEADTLAPALASLLASDYPDLEIVLVNDRSTDATGDLMEAMAAGDPRVQVVHLDSLPPGWLGKNHAMHQGAQRASGRWILFSDADVVFQSDTLARAVSLAEDRQVEHLVLSPRVIADTFWEKIFLSYFGTAFCFRFRPDRVADRGRFFAGIGAFNLVLRQPYLQLGGHSTLALQVLDDMELGRLFKLHGYRQHFAGAGSGVQVRWAVGLRGLVMGLEKNAFAGVNYSLLLGISGSLASLLASLVPLLLLDPQADTWLRLVCWVGIAISSLAVSPGTGTPVWAGAFFPLAGSLFSFIFLRSIFLAQYRGGIYWRGQFYPLCRLKEAQRALRIPSS